jgi:hypothetical protein
LRKKKEKELLRRRVPERREEEQGHRLGEWDGERFGRVLGLQDSLFSELSWM